MDLEICQVAFNITTKQVYDNVQATIDHYGTVDNFAGRGHGDVRILTVNGNVDPWSTLGLRTNSSTCDMPIRMVDGASHHFWTHPIKETDSKEIVEIRQYIIKVMLNWLGVVVEGSDDDEKGTSCSDDDNNNNNDEGIMGVEVLIKL